MLDDFESSQYVAYMLFKNSILNDKLAHAYLIDSNGYKDSYEFVISVVKMIFCNEHYTNNKKCDVCNQCKRIDDNNFLEFKIIEPTGLTIKKEQLIDLQDDFSKSGIESNKRVYLIKSCEKMTLQAANSLLKFLEEPDNNIIAFLLTDNINNVISTIVSRCQIIKLKKNSIKFNENFIDNFRNTYSYDIEDEDVLIIRNNLVKFINYFEENYLDVLVFSKNLWHNNFKDRIQNIIAINLMVNFYFDMLKYKCNIDNLFFCDNKDDIIRLSKLNSISKLVYKIDVLIKNKDLILNNVNLNLFIDNLVMELGGIDENS